LPTSIVSAAAANASGIEKNSSLQQQKIGQPLSPDTQAGIQLGPATQTSSGIKQNAFFPCSDVFVKGLGQLASEPTISKDWLSGEGGRFSTTNAADTYTFKPVTILFGYMEALGFFFTISPASGI
jgi:hypothetical protein